jgi:HAE1 family hydrophobic/amphiphilic exporter-1
MIVATLMVLGVFSYLNLGVGFFPKIDLPNIVVTTTLPGSGPREIETQVTKVIEEAVNTISGIDELRSVSYEGLSQVVVVFKLNRDPDICAQDVRDRVGRILSRLPEGVDSPIIEKFSTDASPVITVVVSGGMPIRDLTEFARRQVKESLESVSGVGQITMVGGREREIHIALDPMRMIALQVTACQIRAALKRQNIEIPGGRVETGSQDILLRTAGRITRVEDFAKVAIQERDGSTIKLGDLATIEDSQEEERSLARLQGIPAISLVIRKQSGSNTVQVIQEVKEKMKELRGMVPEGVKLVLVRDQSRFILASFHSVMEHLISGSLLAALVVFLFLGTLRSTLIAAIAIPTSLIATFTLMKFQDFTLDQMSMLGLTLAVGMVIDDAIVVLENIFRHIDELGADPVQAAREGTQEIALAVLATTASLVVIFVPVAFMPGIVGKFLNSFGLTMAFAVCVSTLISFVLTPPMCAYLLRKSDVETSSNEGWIERFLTAPYVKLLKVSMRHRWLVMVLSFLCMLATIPLVGAVSHDFIPHDDQSEFLVNIKAAEGTPLKHTSEILAQIEAELDGYPEVKILLSTIGEKVGAGQNEGELYVGLSPIENRDSDQFHVMDRIRSFLTERFPELRSAVSVVPQVTGGGFRQTDLDISFQGPELKVLEETAREVHTLLKGIPGVVDLDTSLTEGKPEVVINVDRERAASLGVDLFDLASTLRLLVGGDEEQITRYKDPARSEEYEVRIRLAERFRNSPEDLKILPIRARKSLLPLGSIAKFRQALGPTKIHRYGRQRQVSVYSNLRGVGLGEAQAAIDSRMKAKQLPPGYSYGYLGRSKVMKEQQQGFLLAFSLSSIFMYIVLAAQFESLVHPITILLSLPLCVPFGILSLLLAGEAMNLYSTLGLFMLFGIVKKNSILQVDYANSLRATGMGMLPAILESNKTRLRPILMTTFTLVAGMLPMAIGVGPGAGSRRSMAIVVIGGQTLCLLITLLLTPVAYSIFDEWANARPVRWFWKRLK